MLTQEFPDEFDFEIFDLKNKVTTLSRVTTSLKQTDMASLGERNECAASGARVNQYTSLATSSKPVASAKTFTTEWSFGRSGASALSTGEEPAQDYKGEDEVSEDEQECPPDSTDAYLESDDDARNRAAIALAEREGDDRQQIRRYYSHKIKDLGDYIIYPTDEGLNDIATIGIFSPGVLAKHPSLHALGKKYKDTSALLWVLCPFFYRRAGAQMGWSSDFGHIIIRRILKVLQIRRSMCTKLVDHSGITTFPGANLPPSTVVTELQFSSGYAEFIRNRGRTVGRSLYMGNGDSASTTTHTHDSTGAGPDSGGKINFSMHREGVLVATT
ncbi:hypothetical protein S40293_01488 [Stachybotrys chartarum IBT 40293]|nr:hypothetical protein S40293_01488 [Stachybotrys chartarum IBT 40293]